MSSLIRILMVVLLALPGWTVGAAESEIENRNKVELFLGNTQNGSANGASIGVAYERRLTRLFGVGGYVEHAAGDFDTTAVGADFLLHPHAGWVFKFSPGVEFDDGSRNLQFRIGGSYEFVVAPGWSLAPELNVELVDGERNFVYGLVTGYEF